MPAGLRILSGPPAIITCSGFVFGEGCGAGWIGTASMLNPRINLLRMEEDLSAVHLRLVGVSMEHLSWEDFVERYDKSGSMG